MKKPVSVFPKNLLASTDIAFDSDVMTKPPVRAALARLNAFLASRGARVRLVFLPAGAERENPCRSVLHPRDRRSRF